MRWTGFYDKDKRKIMQHNTVRYKNREFNVYWCNGAFKLMETKSFLEGGTDGWLHEVLGNQCLCYGDKILNEFEVI